MLSSHMSGSNLMQTPSTMAIPSPDVSAPKAWLVNFLHRTALLPNPDNRRVFDELSVAVETLSLDVYRNDSALLEIWCIYLELHLYSLF